MSDLNDALLELRYLGLQQLPAAGDAADRRLREALAQEFAGRRSRRLVWTGRRVRIGPFTFAPVALLAVFAATAVAAGAVITTSATTLFQKNPQQQSRDHAGVFPDPETVITASVHEVTSTTIPDYGRVEFWAATTKQRGFCFALKLPDGTFGGYPLPKPLSLPAANGWAGGTVPGCFGWNTQQRVVLADPPLKPGQQPTNPTVYAGGGPLPVEAWGSLIQNKARQPYDVYVGYVEVQGTAASVRDSKTGATAPVNSDGYFLLAEPSPWFTLPHKLPGFPKRTHCAGCDVQDLQVLNAAGQTLKPDYTYGAMLPGYTPGPSKR
jgi:hypothetical protein